MGEGRPTCFIFTQVDYGSTRQGVCLIITNELHIPVSVTGEAKHFRFLSRVSILLLTRDIDIVILSVRPSVCPSVTRWYCMKTA